MKAATLLDPRSRRPLRPLSAHALADDRGGHGNGHGNDGSDGSDPDGSDGSHPYGSDSGSAGGGGGNDRRWPLVDGIAYLRVDRDALRREALAALDAGDRRAALALLLTDQDPFAPLPPPSTATTAALVDAVDSGEATLRDAMRALSFGPVADYFAHRISTPTYLSGLALLAHGGRPAGSVVELACGIGQFLRELAARRVPALGVDLVFAKLWLARRFVAPAAELVCADAVNVPLAASAPLGVLCHDAFYFLGDKTAAARRWTRLAGVGGRVLVGHAHAAGVAHAVAGTPLSPAGYAALFPGCALYDDTALTESALTAAPASPRLAEALGAAHAVSLVWPGPDAAWWPDILLPPAGVALRPNPLLRERDGRVEPHWPSPRFADEYGDAARYLAGPAPGPAAVRRAAGGLHDDPDGAALARRRVLVDLPERW